MDLIQTDTGGVCGTPTPFCTPRAYAFGITWPRVVDPAGIPGSTAFTGKLLPGESNVLAVIWESVPLGLTTWTSGIWTVPLRIVTPNRYIVWTETYICRVGADCSSLASVGSVQGQSIPLAGAAVYSMDVAGAVQAASLSDKAIILLAFTCTAQGKKEELYEFMSDQVILSPL